MSIKVNRVHAENDNQTFNQVKVFKRRLFRVGGWGHSFIWPERGDLSLEMLNSAMMMHVAIIKSKICHSSSVCERSTRHNENKLDFFLILFLENSIHVTFGPRNGKQHTCDFWSSKSYFSNTTNKVISEHCWPQVDLN